MSMVVDQPGMFMMPKEFGPCGGPRRRPDGKRFVYDDYIDYNAYGVIAEAANPEQLEKLIPPGAVLKNPYVIFCIDWPRKIPWLGKHEYALLYVLIHIKVEGDEGEISGQFASAVWENHVDPILTGREQLGWCKLYCEISQPEIQNGAYVFRTAKYGNEFLRMKIDPNAPVQNQELFHAVIEDSDNQGMIHYKHMPRAQAPFTVCDSDYLALTPMASVMPEDYQPLPKRESVFECGEGEFRMKHLTWEQAPTQCDIINALADIEIKRFLGGFYSRTDAIDDLYDQHIIKHYT